MYKETVKAKTASKTITLDPEALKKIVLETVREASQLVGSTLGPNGKLVLIERQENLPPFTTKDGITVFKSMSFKNPTKQAILEAARDSSSKTNVEAGDGTTTATILAEALIRLGFEYISKNPKVSFQKVMRELESVFEHTIETFINENSLKIDDTNDVDLMKKVALIATNYDEKMAQAVVDAFELVGHNGNITIMESSGSPGFGVQKIDGFPIPRGFEDSCGRFMEEFINDRNNYRTIIDKPHFILFNGKITEPQVLLPILEKIAMATENENSPFSPNLVVVAHAFSETVLAFMAQNFKNPSSLNMLPLKTPMLPGANSQYHFLMDLAAYTGASVFDPLSKPLAQAELVDLGLDTMEHFEFNRYRSTVIGTPDEFLIIHRAEELTAQMKGAESSLDQELLQERAGVLTGGIAKITVFGSSDSELKEKNHRVEDAVCAIKGALKYGVLPGCSKTLLTLALIIQNQNVSEAVKEIMVKAMRVPFTRILANGGYTSDEIKEFYNQTMDGSKPFFFTYDALNRQHGDAVEMGILDSASAVLMSIKNALSVAKMLMGLSGVVVFDRDFQTEVGLSKDLAAQHEAMQQAIAERDKEIWTPEF